MKKAIAISLTCMLVVFSLASFLLLPQKDGGQDTQSVVTTAKVVEQQYQTVSEPFQEKTDKEALPDYHPDKSGTKDTLRRRELSKPPSLEETVATVESSLNDRIRALNQNLGDPKARAILQRQLSSSEMDAYKAAVVWTVKNKSAIDQD